MAIDDYRPAAERRQARSIDIDRYWWEVKDEWIEELGGNGGLSFLDAFGFHYYLPALMSYWLRRGKEPLFLSFHLEPTQRTKWEHLLTTPQRATLIRFQQFLTRQDSRMRTWRRKSR